MNPNAPSPSFELPVPQSNTEGDSLTSSGNRLPSQAEKMPQPVFQSSVPPSVPAQPTATSPLPMPMTPVSDPSQQAQTPIAAEDSDLIEKEWVEKAKQIVAATRDNPHEQNKQISRFKADYLKKRYNKDIKVEDL